MVGFAGGNGRFYGGQRGKVVTFSLKSSSRLRDYLLEHARKGCKVFKSTLTLPGDHDPVLWDRLRRRITQRALRAGVAFVWRVELQRRKVPHLHLVAWVPEGTAGHRVFSEGWYEALPDDRQRMRGARRHCAHVQKMPDGDCGHEWFAYLVGHSCKGKREQLGWKGRQWGVVGRRLMERVFPVKFYPMTLKQRARFNRYVSRFFKGKREGNIHADRAVWKKVLSGMSAASRDVFRRKMTRDGHLPIRRRRLTAGRGWSRVIDPARLQRLAEWAVSGQ